MPYMAKAAALLSTASRSKKTVDVIWVFGY